MLKRECLVKVCFYIGQTETALIVLRKKQHATLWHGLNTSNEKVFDSGRRTRQY